MCFATISIGPRFASRSILLLIGIVLSGCISGGGGRDPADLEPGDLGVSAPKTATLPGRGRAEEKALLLLTEDRRLYEPITVERALLAGGETRERLALALGRIAHPEGLQLLEEFLLDENPQVRRNAAFTFLVAAHRSDLPASFVRRERGLASAVSDPDPDVARWSLQAMAVAGVGLEGCLAAVERRVGDEAEGGSEERGEGTDETDLWRILVGALFFLPVDEGQQAARLGLERLPFSGDDPDRQAVRRELFTVMARNPDSEGPALAPLARDLLEEDDARMQRLAAGVLGETGDARDVDGLWALSAPGSSTAALESSLLRATALDAVGRLLTRGVRFAPSSYLPELLSRLDDPVPRVRRAAFQIVDLWLPEEGLAAELIERIATEGAASAAERQIGELSLVALARGEHPRAAELVERASRAEHPEWRAGGARAAAILGLAEPLERLSNDNEPIVRARVLEARMSSLSLPESKRRAFLREALRDPSSQVRRAAYGHLIDSPEVGLEDLLIGLDRLPDASGELRLAAVDAVYRFAESTAIERGGSIALLEKLVEDPAWPVRRRAAMRLEDLGRPKPPVPKPQGIRGPDYYRGITQTVTGVKRLELETTGGDLTLELECNDAPQTCVSVLQLAQQSFYDGLPFFADGPCLLVTGDPNGDGYGGPGYRLRDEPVAIRADQAGVVLIRRTAADAGSSQLAITLCPQDQLDGDWPAVGRVVEGLENLGRLGAGESVFRLRELRP